MKAAARQPAAPCLPHVHNAKHPHLGRTRPQEAESSHAAYTKLRRDFEDLQNAYKSLVRVETSRSRQASVPGLASVLGRPPHTSSHLPTRPHVVPYPTTLPRLPNSPPSGGAHRGRSGGPSAGAAGALPRAAGQGRRADGAHGCGREGQGTARHTVRDGDCRDRRYAAAFRRPASAPATPWTLGSPAGKLAGSEAGGRGLQRDLDAAKYAAQQLRAELEEVRACVRACVCVCLYGFDTRA
jgi:hypothetical protein